MTSYFPLSAITDRCNARNQLQLTPGRGPTRESRLSASLDTPKWRHFPAAPAVQQAYTSVDPDRPYRSPSLGRCCHCSPTRSGVTMTLGQCLTAEGVYDAS